MEIMQVIWKDGSATARQITDALSAKSPIAHSTVQTLLRKLEVKGAVEHRQLEDERAFRFFPLVARDDVSEHAAHELLFRVFDGSVFGLVSHLLKNEKVSDEEFKRLKTLIDSHKEEETNEK
jgi:BlaI family penicillinase repressor